MARYTTQESAQSAAEALAAALGKNWTAETPLRHGTMAVLRTEPAEVWTCCVQRKIGSVVLRVQETWPIDRPDRTAYIATGAYTDGKHDDTAWSSSYVYTAAFPTPVAALEALLPALDGRRAWMTERLDAIEGVTRRVLSELSTGKRPHRKTRPERTEE